MNAAHGGAGWLRRLTAARAVLSGNRAGAAPAEDHEWLATCARVAPLIPGAADQRARLRKVTDAFLAAKRIDGAGGLAPSRALALEIAVLAAIPVREIGIDWYRAWRTVVVYPGGFLARRRFEDETGVVHEYQQELAGEAWADGPVILSRDDLAADREDCFVDGSVAVHEFAHQIDLAGGVANGCPPLHRGMSLADWSGAFSAAYADLERRERRGAALPLPDDALDDPGEFFAVASEWFFTASARLHRIYPAVYRQLSLFYRQDPRIATARCRGPGD